jgi:hypothetical protein
MTFRSRGPERWGFDMDGVVSTGVDGLGWVVGF